MLLSRLTLLISLGVAVQSAYASGFAIIEQSVTGLGRAFSGSAAVADDASTIFFNPAGLTQLDSAQLNLGLNFVKPKARFTDDGSTMPLALGGTPLSGGHGGIATDSAIVPNFYYAHPVNDRVVLGLGIGAPFGLVTDYDRDWQGRYHGHTADLKVVNINPSIAFKTTDKLSFGVGLNVQHADLKLSQGVDFGAVCAIAGAGFCAQPQNLDGQAKVTADSWGWGYNLGLTFQATEATRLGLHYRSRVRHEFEGKGRFRIPAAAQSTATSVGFIDGDASGKLSLPESLSLAIHHQINSQWAIMADATWTRWSRFETLKIDSDIARLDSEKRQEWENTWRVGVGLEYQHNDRWSFRSGVAYDESPIADKYHRTPRIPDSDRRWFSIGASYQYSENLIIDAAYAHLFMSKAKIDDTDSNGYRLVGSYDSQVDLFGVQVRWIFD